MSGLHALKAGDPSLVGGYRLLGRLGAGGMGVVYPARSAGGALVALKVIRAEYAADDGFRTRFRREAEAAGGLTGQWLVSVTAADPGAREPWLATAFVPGPSLAEAVALYGPLPYDTVRALGARLAEALTEVHAAGLVHRDVKPGNVLLALDGPRLIDFGIARSTGATALTASDVVIGSPGYLSPEQAQARAGDIGPPRDIFALGCVLAYAATGRRPFGTGTPAAVIYRTVHEEPDLGSVPRALAPLLTGCLTKDPRARPTARELRDALAGGGEREGDWLPPELPRLIAERSAAVLALPDPDPATLMLPPERPALCDRPDRRRHLGRGRRRPLREGPAAPRDGLVRHQCVHRVDGPHVLQLRPDDSTLSTAFVHYLTHTAKSLRTAVIDDRAANRFSWEIVKDLTEWPPADGTTTSHVVPADSEDFGPAVAAALAAEAQAVVYAGASPHRAALCARALEQAGFRGTRMAPEPVLEAEFLTEAGTAAEGWLISTAYVDPAGLPAAARFVAAYKKRFAVRTVEPFAVEAYDALLFVAQGLRALGTAAVERGAMVHRLRAATYKGLAKTIEFDTPTDEFHGVNGLFLHRVENGTPRFLGRYDQVKET